jgi:hypothetical protein
MATLQSPGVAVTVIDESFYTPAEPGTTPLFVLATQMNKKNGAGTATAAGTIAANIGQVYKMTSQKEIVDTFGVPFFEKTASGSPVHGGELNEYGLLAAYSYLGSSNSAIIVRANVDLGQLTPKSVAPGAEAADGQWWLDTANTTWGVQEWNAATVANGGQKFITKYPLVLADSDTATKIEDSMLYGRAPKASVGSIGDYCIVAETAFGSGPYVQSKETIRLFYKSAGNIAAGVSIGQWVLVGSPEWCSSFPVVTFTPGVGSIKINGTTVTTAVSASTTATTINNLAIAGVTATASGSKVSLYSNGGTEGAADSTRSGAVVVTVTSGASGLTAGTYLQPKLTLAPHTEVPLYKINDTKTDAASGNAANGYPTGSVWIKTTEPGFGSRWRLKRYNAATKSWVAISAPLYESGNSALYYLDRTGGGKTIALDSIYVQYNSDEQFSYASPDTTPDVPDALFTTGSYRLFRRAGTGNTVITSKVITDGTFTATARAFTIQESGYTDGTGSLVEDLSPAKTIYLDTTRGNQLTGIGLDDAIRIAAAINAAGFQHIEASVTGDYELQIYHKQGGDFRLKDTTGTPLATLFTPSSYSAGSWHGSANFYSAPAGSASTYIASTWQPLAIAGYSASSTAPLNEPSDGQLWYNSNFGQVDIMVHNGTTWVGYRTVKFGDNVSAGVTDRYGPVVSASKPTARPDGAAAFVTGDLWISTADMENFPTIYRYNNENPATNTQLRWELVDKTDQTTETGILFADARAGTSGGTTTNAPSGTIEELLTSNFLDTDAPDPALYPKGMMLWNLRRSGGNVKKYKNNYIKSTEDNQRMPGKPSMDSYWPDRWTTASPNNEDGSGTFGRKAQRAVIIAAMKSSIDTNLLIRDTERRNFNLVAAPGYPEVYANMVNLNIDRGLTSFIIADTPLRLAADATSLTTWGTNAKGVVDNGDDGVVTYDEYSALYYPNGFTTDLSGTNAVVPASHMMLKTIAISDAVSYPWFAPAGTRRGGITNATSVGYLNAMTGEFQTVSLNEGQRNTLYDLKINPIPFFVGIGNVAFGQKTRARNASALDRINVARLVVYLRSQLNKLARPYIFEPNDKITRDEIKGAVESLLLELVGLRAIYDFAVVCDTSNNLPSTIDKNELYVDIAITPVKAVEFIYIPLRVKNTGEI